MTKLNARVGVGGTHCRTTRMGIMRVMQPKGPMPWGVYL